MPNDLKIKNGLLVDASGSAIFAVDGTAGRLFLVNDGFTGSLFSVNTISGLPVIEAFSDNTVKIGKFASEAIILTASGTLASITGSLLGTATTASVIFTGYYVTQSKGGTWYNSLGFSAGDTGSITVWRAPYPCTASTIYAYREGGTTAAVSASRNGLPLTGSNIVLANASQYYSSSATTNQNFSTGDRLELNLISFSGTVTEVNIQVDIIR